jgi:hypothetical protein
MRKVLTIVLGVFVVLCLGVVILFTIEGRRDISEIERLQKDMLGTSIIAGQPLSNSGMIGIRGGSRTYVFHRLQPSRNFDCQNDERFWIEARGLRESGCKIAQRVTGKRTVYISASPHLVEISDWEN